MDDSLTSFIEEVCGDSHLRVEDDLGGGYVRLRISEAERRQAKQDIRSVEDVVIEMLRNARDAHSRNIFIATSREGSVRNITMIDDGDGVLQNMQQEIFKPRVTSKLDSMQMDKWGVHGRGMALYSIKSNVDEIKIVQSAPGFGTSFVLTVNLADLPEKTDQSSFPTLSIDENDASIIFRGPKNIIRTTVEFAYSCQEKCSIYLGSTTDIAATIYEYGISTVSKSKRLFKDDCATTSLVKRLAYASDPESFSYIASTIGLNISSRSARRILSGEIKPMEDTLTTIMDKSKFGNTYRTKSLPDKKKLLEKDVRGLKILDEDLDMFRDSVKVGYRSLARDYYLEPSVVPDIKITSDELVIRIPLSKIR